MRFLDVARRERRIGGLKSWVIAGSFVLVHATFWCFLMDLSSDAFFALGAAIAGVSAYLAWVYRHAARMVVEGLRAKPLDPVDEPRPYSLVEQVAAAAGSPMPALLVIESPTVNLCAVGMAPDRAGLVFTRGALERLDEGELAGLLGNELSEIANGDVARDTFLAALMWNASMAGRLLAAFAQGDFRLKGWLGGMLAELLPAAVVLFLAADTPISWLLPVAMVPWVVLYLMAWPLLGRVIQVVLSRSTDLVADAESVRLTRHPPGLVSAIARTPGAGSLDAPAAMDHLFVVEARDCLIRVHVSAEERIERLRGMLPAGEEPGALREGNLAERIELARRARSAVLALKLAAVGVLATALVTAGVGEARSRSTVLPELHVTVKDETGVPVASPLVAIDWMAFDGEHQHGCWLYQGDSGGRARIVQVDASRMVAGNRKGKLEVAAFAPGYLLESSALVSPGSRMPFDHAPRRITLRMRKADSASEYASFHQGLTQRESRVQLASLGLRADRDSIMTPAFYGQEQGWVDEFFRRFPGAAEGPGILDVAAHRSLDMYEETQDEVYLSWAREYLARADTSYGKGRGDVSTARLRMLEYR